MMNEQDDYRKFLDKVGPGTTLSEREWLFHFEHQNLDASDGLAVDSFAPDFVLPDQSGASQSRADLSGDNGLLLVFARSADW